MADTLARPVLSSMEGNQSSFSDKPAADKPLSTEAGLASKFSLRALISSKEAGVVIGKGGTHIANIRSNFNVGAGVSKNFGETNPRILTISGTLEGVASSYQQVAASITQEAANEEGGAAANPSAFAIHLLVDHYSMGSIIGRGGAKIEAIQKSAKVHMVAKRDMLPGSTEREIEIQGAPENIKAAILEIGQCLLADSQIRTSDRSILYDPSRARPNSGPDSLSTSAANNSSNQTGSATSRPPRRNGAADYSNRTGNGADFANPEDGESITQNISIPSDMVGCIIGKQGSKIREIRTRSNARISIAQGPHDETGERMFTIFGPPNCVEHALYLLYESLEAEKYRRSENHPPAANAQASE